MQAHKARSSVAYSLNAKLNFRIIVVGDSAVGKTSLIVRYVKGTFSKNYTISLGVEFYSKMVETNEGEQIALQIWDTAGQQNFKSIVKSFYNKASCVLITYSNPKMLQKTLSNYTLEINEHAVEGVRVVVVRTKIDDKPLTQEETQILNQCVKDEKIDFWKEVSSLSGQNIQHLFNTLANQLHNRYIASEQFREIVNPKKDSFHLGDQGHKLPDRKQKRKKKCCQ